MASAMLVPDVADGASVSVQPRGEDSRTPRPRRQSRAAWAPNRSRRPPLHPSASDHIRYPALQPLSQRRLLLRPTLGLQHRALGAGQLFPKRANFDLGLSPAVLLLRLHLPLGPVIPFRVLLAPIILHGSGTVLRGKPDMRSATAAPHSRRTAAAARTSALMACMTSWGVLLVAAHNGISYAGAPASNRVNLSTHDAKPGSNATAPDPAPTICEIRFFDSATGHCRAFTNACRHPGEPLPAYASVTSHDCAGTLLALSNDSTRPSSQGNRRD